MNLGNSARDLASNKRLTAARAFMVEQNTIARMHSIRLTIVDGDPIRVQLGHT